MDFMTKMYFWFWLPLSPTTKCCQIIFKLKLIKYFFIDRDCLFRVVAIWWIHNDIFIKVLFILFEGLQIQSICLLWVFKPSFIHYSSFFHAKNTYNLPNGDDSKQAIPLKNVFWNTYFFSQNHIKTLHWIILKQLTVMDWLYAHFIPHQVILHIIFSNFQ